MDDSTAAARAGPGRFEYRVFAPSLSQLRERLARAAERSESDAESRETYLLDRDPRRGIKLRGERVEEKRWIESRLGCQRWRPVTAAMPDAGFERCLVHKQRRRFWLGETIAEWVQLRIGEGADAREVQSVAVEGDDVRAVARRVDELGLRARANLGYPQYLRASENTRGGFAMGIEIERKFRVTGDGWRRRAVESTQITQGYLVAEPERSVRVRRSGERAWLAIKGATRGTTRTEFEYPIPPADALEMLAWCPRAPIEKTRHLVPGSAGHTFEVDEFHGDNEGLVVAEVELGSPEEEVEIPDWLGEEVTGDARYYNARLVEHPFAHWSEARADERVDPGGAPPGADRLADTLLALLDERLGGEAERIRVEVEDGTARLHGAVSRRSDADLAEAIASSLGGIERVENRLRVETREPEDVQPTPGRPDRDERPPSDA